ALAHARRLQPPHPHPAGLARRGLGARGIPAHPPQPRGQPLAHPRGPDVLGPGQRRRPGRRRSHHGTAGGPAPHACPARADRRTHAVSEQTPPDEPAQRVRITSPLSSAPAHVRSTVGQEIDEATGVGEVYMQSLIRSQLRAALTVAVTLLLTVVSLPLLFLFVPGLNDVRVLGVPVPWLILGAGV